ncbi:MAG TPA: ATP-binding protein [Pyrinomonadaceae bacterium]|nr:ATP-binding protein [Pyrinomonadaceae bacterium]
MNNPRQPEFLIEIEELIEKLFRDVDALRESSGNPNLQRRSIDQIFRHAHSVKGLAAAIGLDSVSEIAHAFETVLDALRMGRVSIDEPVLVACENAVEALSDSLNLAANESEQPPRRELFEQLQAAARSQASASGHDEILETLPSEIWQSLSDQEKQRLTMVLDEGSPLFLVTANFPIASFDQEFFQLRELLAERGEVLATSPAVDLNNSERVDFRILYASAATDFHQKVSAQFKRIEAKRQPQRSSVQPAPSVSALTNFVRTDLEKLDQLISATYELFRTTTNALESRNKKKNHGQVDATAESIRSSFLGLQDELINLRLVSLRPVLQRALRMGRSAARTAAKEIDFELVEKDLRVDKVLGDALADPLFHLIRNAVDHGIESAAERASIGKSKRATIRIEAFHEGAQTRIRISDDGRGIDPALISAAALRLGLITDGSQLDAERSLRLIFRPGFTTLESATEISGRGVGLDVVETAIENAGGELRVSSALSVGTTFEILLPVTFGLLTASVLLAGGKRYCLPAEQVVSIEDLSGARSKGEPAIELTELLGTPPVKAKRKTRKLVTCKSFEADERFQVAVDGVELNQEILVRSLGRHAGRWYGVSGAAELRDGEIVLVLDLARLLHNSQAVP